MKILYLVGDDISINSGVTQKIEGQVSVWKNEGNNVIIVSLRSSTNTSFISNGLILADANRTNLFQKFTKHYKAIRKLKQLIGNFSPDLIYLRYIKYVPTLVSVFGDIPLVMEINTNDVKEYKLRNYIIHVYNLLTRRFLLNRVDAYVSVTEELARASEFSRYSKKSITIANGINTEKFVHWQKRSNTNIGKYKLGFIGSPGQPWHGIEKIFTLAGLNPDFEFYIIGSKSEDFGIELPNVFILGYLDFENSCMILKNCDVAISTLSLYEKDMNEASPLKTRQYLSLGLPVIVAYSDTDLSRANNFILKIDNTPDNVLRWNSRIRDFVYESRQFDSTLIVKFAEQYLDFCSKEAMRLKFFKTICDD